jgi:hypothetical protein
MAIGGDGGGMTSESRDSTDALEVLGNETRMAILRELAEADGALAYTELKDRVGVRDSGKFNYHLTRLCEYFVRETGDGYELGHAGSRVIAATESATGPVAGPAESDGSDVCPVCGDEDCERLFHVHLSVPWR